MIKSIKNFIVPGLLLVAFVSARGILAAQQSSLVRNSCVFSKVAADSAFKARMNAMLNNAVSSVNARMRGRVQIRAQAAVDMTVTGTSVGSN